VDRPDYRFRHGAFYRHAAGSPARHPSRPGHRGPGGSLGSPGDHAGRRRRDGRDHPGAGHPRDDGGLRSGSGVRGDVPPLATGDLSLVRSPGLHPAAGSRASSGPDRRIPSGASGNPQHDRSTSGGHPAGPSPPSRRADGRCAHRRPGGIDVAVHRHPPAIPGPLQPLCVVAGNAGGPGLRAAVVWSAGAHGNGRPDQFRGEPGLRPASFNCHAPFPGWSAGAGVAGVGLGDRRDQRRFHPGGDSGAVSTRRWPA